MNVTVFIPQDDAPSIIVSTTLGQFFADNIEAMSAIEIDAIEQALTSGKPYHGGGGASPEWSICPGP